MFTRVLRVCLPMHWALNHLELELKTIVSLHVGVGSLRSLDEQSVLTAEPSLLFFSSSSKRSPIWFPKECLFFSLLYFKEQKYPPKTCINISILK